MTRAHCSAASAASLPTGSAVCCCLPTTGGARQTPPSPPQPIRALRGAARTGECFWSLRKLSQEKIYPSLVTQIIPRRLYLIYLLEKILSLFIQKIISRKKYTQFIYSENYSKNELSLFTQKIISRKNILSLFTQIITRRIY